MAQSFCGPADIYGALTSAGFSTVQAIGAMANAIAESSLNPEASVIDSNGARSNGLWQFNEASYPDSGKLITGNCANDIISQVGYLKTHISGNALNGSTGAEVAGNFAASFEGCQGCQPGGSQHAQRVANAATVEGWINSGHWPTSAAGITGSSGGGSGGGNLNLNVTLTAASSRCLVGGSGVIPCLLDASQARALIGGLMMLAGGLVAIPGLVVLLVTVGGPVAAPAARTISKVTPAGRAVKLAGRVAPSPASQGREARTFEDVTDPGA